MCSIRAAGIASAPPGRYDLTFMTLGPRKASLLVAALVLAAAVPSLSAQARPQATASGAAPEIFPLDRIQPGMKGVAYTIFSGDEPEPMDVEVLGVMPNLLGPRQHIILVKLTGPKAEHTGVAFGMSGSPVYIEGKLAGAISLLMAIFAKEPIAGVTPIERILEVGDTAASVQRAGAGSEPAAYPLPSDWTVKTGAEAGAYLTPIDTPLVFSGFHPATLRHFAPELRSFGMVAVAGGTAEPRPDDADLKPGDMASLVLVKGDLSLQASCTVTAVVGDRVYVCGHPVFNFGALDVPMARGRVVTTMASSFASSKVVNAGGIIGRFTQDARTAVLGRLGSAPPLIPVEMEFVTTGEERKFRFEVIEHNKLTPLLVTISVFNGLIASPAYSEGTTFQLTGEIQLKGHSAVSLENMFAPTDAFIPDGVSVALAVQNIFGRIFSNPYERAEVERVRLKVTSVPQRRVASIESAWSEKSEASPGEQINVKVLLRPYRGAPVMHEVPITIPPQAARGTLRILVSDSETLNRMGRFFTLGPQSRLAGLEQLIKLLNRERRNNRLYVVLLQPTPTLLVEDKELPNAPLSQINVLDQRRAPGSSLLLRESVAGEWSLPMNQVITGQYLLTIQVR
jgi:hypothetical protein